jgi:Fe-Mn family superoxide dismutase
MLEDIITILVLKSMAPKPDLTYTVGLISRDFWSYENFVTTFKSEATKQFGSAGFGWSLINQENYK